MLYYRSINYVNARQLEHLKKPETILLERELKRLNKNDLIYNVLISNYLLNEEKEKRKKQEIVIKDLKICNNNYNKNNNKISKKNNNKISKKNNKMNSDKTYSNTISKDYKISENQSLRNYLYEINTHNQKINDNINSKNKFYNNKAININTEKQENHNRFSVLNYI
tara:strand:+ start:1148 stop:1648 length:501 start_codon:yes stop_codon:yes gene_type:complete